MPTSFYNKKTAAIFGKPLRKLQKHPNVMKLYGLSFKQDAGTKFLQIIMEHCEDSLYNIVMVKRKPTACGSFQTLKDCKKSWTFVLNIMEGLCLALDYIHNKGFVHRDLKLSNVMVKGECSVRLADFGLSKKEANITGTLTGTPLYMAPEVLMGHLYGTEADIYSLGMIIYELWYYRPVFSVPLQADSTKFEFTVKTIDELKEYKTLREGKPNLDIAHKPPLKLKYIMQDCWNEHKEVRPSATKSV
ncbi:unnamed protein product [Mytilus edulis]|uniref:Protein kinase domain-containing protein n=1 Tax=Mytilus edulis TaxID=6550 RepID=A0A8S3VHR5_MYTED|nr:unnamed protein product [Mytilus edulis]